MKSLEFLKTNKDSKLRLICCHHSGGGSSFFYPWIKYFDSIEFVAIQLPGRERRFNEPFLKDMEMVINHLLEDFRYLLEKPYLLFGHSLGGLICFELTKRLQELSLAIPKHLIISGCRAPHLPSRRKALYDIPDNEFISEISKYNGIPKEILSDSGNFLELFLPILRADFTISDTYQYLEGVPLFCDIIAMGGCDDPMVPEIDIQPWVNYTYGNFKYFSLQGDHFFIKSSQEAVLSIINSLIEITRLAIEEGK